MAAKKRKPRSRPFDPDFPRTREELVSLIVAAVQPLFMGLHDRLDRIERRLDDPDTGLAAINARLDNVETGLGAINARLDDPHTGLGAINARLDDVETGLGAINARLDDPHTGLAELKKGIDELKSGSVGVGRMFSLESRVSDLERGVADILKRLHGNDDDDDDDSGNGSGGTPA